MEILLKLIIGHFIFDYPLQGDFLSKAKNPFNPLPNVPWIWAMTAHATMHAGVVWFVLGNFWWLILGEFVMHFLIDYRKCAGKITFGQDQLLHMWCKVVWVASMMLM